jgi:hypothetical protein
VRLAGGVHVQQLCEVAVERRIEEAVADRTGRERAVPDARRETCTGPASDAPVLIRTGVAHDIVANGWDDTRLSGAGCGGTIREARRGAGRSGGADRAPTQTGTSRRRAGAPAAETCATGRPGDTSSTAETSAANARRAARAPAALGVRDVGPRSRRAGRTHSPVVWDRERPRSAGAAQRHDDPCCCAEIEPHAVHVEVTASFGLWLTLLRRPLLRRGARRSGRRSRDHGRRRRGRRRRCRRLAEGRGKHLGELR